MISQITIKCRAQYGEEEWDVEVQTGDNEPTTMRLTREEWATFQKRLNTLVRATNDLSLARV